MLRRKGEFIKYKDSRGEKTILLEDNALYDDKLWVKLFLKPLLKECDGQFIYIHSYSKTPIVTDNIELWNNMLYHYQQRKLI